MRGKSSKNTGRKSRSIEMFDSFLAQRNGDKLEKRGKSISSPADSLAKTSAMPAVEQESKVSGPGFGASLPGSFAYFDHNTSSWKMSQRSLFVDSNESSVIWPRWGMMRNGRAYRLQPLVPRIYDGESSLLPTPRANERGQYQRDQGKMGKERPTLTGVVKGWLPTPRATDGSHGGRITPRKGREGGTLVEAISIRMYPTPRADGRDNAGGSNSRRSAKKRGTYIGRALNPQFVEWLMGFPIGWTDLEA